MGGTLSSGGNQPTVLQEVDVTITTNAVCKNAYGSNSITDVMLCAADSGRDSCQGDSGSPSWVWSAGATDVPWLDTQECMLGSPRGWTGSRPTPPEHSTPPARRSTKNCDQN